MTDFTECDREYLDLVRQLPRPTIEQTALFASYITQAHSWYKHLPLGSKVPFYLYLDPNAGKNIIHTRTGETAVLDITNESNKFHYTWQTTKDYRERFGIWSYHAESGTRFMIASDGGVVTDPRDKGLKVFAPFSHQGAWIKVPLVLQELGQVNLSSIIHPETPLDYWINFNSDYWTDFNEDYFDLDYPPIPQYIDPRELENWRVWQNIWRIFSRYPDIKASTPQLSPSLIKELSQIDLMILSRSLLCPIWDHNEEILELLKTKSFQSLSFVETLLIIERYRTLVSLEFRYLQINHWRWHKFQEEPEEDESRIIRGDLESNIKSSEDIQLLKWMTESRMQQLEEMIAAMNRVVESIYGLE